MYCTATGNSIFFNHLVYNQVADDKFVFCIVLWIILHFTLVQPPLQDSLVPILQNDWWQIATTPDLGVLNSPEQQPVDFGIWKASDGTWQLWSCIRKTWEAGKTRLFYGWSAPSLHDSLWNARGIMQRADTTLGEELGGMQAPYVIMDGHRFLMFYGDWNRICLAESSDGIDFVRTLHDGSPALFGDPNETNTRDAMVIRTEDYWICYYTAHPNQDGAIYARTSDDLRHWSESIKVSYGGHVGTGKFWQAECPFVVYRKGYYYLFRTENYGLKNKTNIYRSKDPLNFGIDDDRYFIGSIPVAAPEIFEEKGTWYLACLNPGLDGIRVGTLQWPEEWVESKTK